MPRIEYLDELNTGHHFLTLFTILSILIFRAFAKIFYNNYLEKSFLQSNLTINPEPTLTSKITRKDVIFITITFLEVILIVWLFCAPEEVLLHPHCTCPPYHEGHFLHEINWFD